MSSCSGFDATGFCFPAGSRDNPFVIDNCTFSNCLATQTNGRGGGVYVKDAALEVTNTYFGRRAEDGTITGTVYTNCYNQGATAARLLIMYIGSTINTSTCTKTPVIKMPPMTVDKDNVSSITPEMRW